MTGELVPITAAPLPERMQYAQALAQADLLPAAYRRKPANVLLAMEYGAAVGITPVAAIQGVHVVEGKPTASAQLIGALVRRAGHRLRVTGDETHAEAQIIRSDDPDFTFTSRWDLERAKTAGLLGKGSWKTYPGAMLKARAITEAARDACPEVLAGIAYTAEELGADPVSPDAAPAAAAPPSVDVEVGKPVVHRRTVTEPDPEDPWASDPAPAVDVTTGEIMDDPDGPPAGSSPRSSFEEGTAAGPTTAPIGKQLAEGGSATSKQMRFINDLAHRLGAASEAERNLLLQAVVGRRVTRLADLTVAEAKQVIDGFKEADGDESVRELLFRTAAAGAES